MKHLLLLISFFTMILIVSCNSNNSNTDSNNNNSDHEKSIVKDAPPKITYINLNDDKAEELINKGNVIVKLSAKALEGALKKTIDEEGTENALVFCNHEALNITDSIANAERVIIKRVAKKYRNPKNETTANASEIYKRYIIEWIEKKPIKPKLVIGENGNPVYYKLIILHQKCLVCHGTRGETIPENISAKIAELYPNDKAIDFKMGQPRGMWSITFPDITVEK